MADLEYTVDINTRGAQRALGGLRSQIAGIGTLLAGAFTVTELTQTAARFEDLRTTLGVLFKDVETGAQAFDQIKAFATESIFSVEDLTNSVLKLKAAGLEPSIEQLRLFADVSSVSADSVGALNAITDLFARTAAGGLGLEELNRLADRGIPVFTILEERLGLTRLELSEFGKTAEGAQTILQALTEGLGEAFSGAQAARAENLSQAMSNLGDALANAFDTIGQSGFNAALGDAIRGITEFINLNQTLIQQIGEALGTAIRVLVDNLNILAAVLAGAFSAAIAGQVFTMASAMVTLAKGLRQAAIAGTILQGVTGVGLVKALAGLAGAAGAIYAIDQAFEETNSTLDQTKKNIDEAQEKLKDGPLSGGLNISGDDVQTTSPGAQAAQKITEELDKQLVKYQANNAEQLRSLRNTRDMLGLSQEQAEGQRVVNAVTENYTRELDALKQKYAELNREPEKNRESLIAVQAAMETLNTQYGDQLSKARALVAEIAQQRADTEAAAEAQQRFTASMERAAESVRTAKQFTDGLTQSTRDAQREMRRASMGPLEREIDGINAKIDRDLNNTVKELRENIDNTNFTVISQQIDKVKAAAEQAKREQAAIARQSYEEQRSFERGWADAFRKYQEEATNSARVAGEVFGKTTQGLEDAIVGFVRTGKFEFRDLINDIAETLLRSQIKRLIADVFAPDGLLGGLGSLFGGLDSLLGGGGGKRGESPSSPLFVQDVRGATAPDLTGLEDLIPSTGSRTPGFGDISDIFGGGDIVNTISRGLGGITDTVGSVVGSITSGIGNLFGGFFANGGFIPPGKFGIVGERGPEMISGPAQITPFAEGGTTVNLNISAVDADSFRGLIARDPEFIASVAQAGSRAIPGRR